MIFQTVAPRALRFAVIAGVVGLVAGCAGSDPDRMAYAPPSVAPQPQVDPRQSAPAPRAPTIQQVAVRGTAFPVDGMRAKIPAGSRLVVRIYDAAGGDVNIRAAEGAFEAGQGLPLRYEVPVAAKAISTMKMPAVAARLEGPRGRVFYRNETAVLLVSGKPGDIPMMRQGQKSASAMTIEWDAPKN